MAEIARAAAEDARLIEECGFTAVLVENFHDAPFLPGAVEPETVAALAVVTRAVVEAVDLPVGVNVLRNDALAALGVAVAAGASFLRVNVLCGAAVTDQGLIQGSAHDLLRRRRALGADVAILADVDVKHATSLDTRPVEHRARDLVSRGGADAVLVTGHGTGQPIDEATLRTVREAVAPCATLVASGTTAESLPALLRASDGVIVGSCLKNPDTGRVDPKRAADLVQRARP
ncbi:MAG: phosphorybosylanthranilate isomerase [Planctomycetota bacterium]|nr:MAG: phosphorybosylanthranilate isomerase [Planctomycetota bacterium]